ncbi:MAG: bifunctional alpha/beta hydrolase/OsmC family protein [Proteobacteria bacterium]|nr:bifunctional alpha/beta hydrolase/OsmC family protein [Pseudomonadota bacterium]
MEQRKVTFDNGDGHELVGILHEPDSDPVAWVLFAHCFTCTKNVKAAVHISQALVEQGFAVLRFDFTGLGESEGEFVDTTFSSNVHDLLAAAKYLEHEHRAAAVLIGHSLGGAAVLRAAGQLDSVQAVATIAAPADPGHVRKLLGDDAERIRQNGSGEVHLAGRPFTIGREFLDDLERDDWQQVIHNLRVPLLIFHSPVDETVSIDNAQLIYESAMHPKSFVSLENADHLLSRAGDSRYVAAVLSAWATRYLESTDAEIAEDDIVEGVVATTGRQKFRTELRSGKHVLVADEPASVGGRDLGPSPYDLLAAALASCTSMTLRMYADRKKIDLDRVSVRVRHDRVHEKDCEECEEDGRRIDRLRREISMAGDLSPEERKRLIEIADRCPVHKTLTNEIRIETREEQE